MPGKIFISYRRDDDPSAAARVRDGLAAKFGRASVFMDVDELLAGQRFDEELAKALAECDVLIAIIGPRWMELLESRASVSDGDFVLKEIAGALKRKIVVIPVRVGREGQLAPLPRQEDLPDDIRDLVLHQKHDVTHENFGRDIDKLVTDIRNLPGSSNKLERAARTLRWAPGIVAAAGAIFVALVGAENVRDAGGWVRGFFEEPERPPIEMTPTKSSSQKQAADLVASKSEVDKAAMIKEAQTLLAELGYDPGEADGLRGVATTDAIKDFQRDMGTASRKIFGQVDQRLISALRVAKRTKLREERIRARQLAEKEKAAAEAEAKQKAEGDEQKRLAMLEEQRKREAEEEARKRDPALTVKPGSGESFKDCPTCPEMVVVPAGSFMMGSPKSEKGRGNDEGPQHRVTINQPFAVGKFEVTWDEWNVCVTDGGCDNEPVEKAGGDNGWGKGRRPVINVNWKGAKAYTAWLSTKTGKPYRLLSEAEWEYAARAGTTTRYSWGNEIGKGNANCDGCGSRFDDKQTAPVGSFTSSDYGLNDMHGNVWEWVQGCLDRSLNGSSFRNQKNDACKLVVKGGSWFSHPLNIRSANRAEYKPPNQIGSIGFRVARSLAPNATSIPATKVHSNRTGCRQLPAALTGQVPLKEGDEFCSATGRKTARVERIHDQSIRFLVNGTKSLTCREGEACAFDWSPSVHFRVTARSDPARGIQPVGALLPR